MVIKSESLKKHAVRLWQRDELPKEFAWMDSLSPLHYRLCLVELYSATGQAHLTGDWDALAHLIEDWEATAAMDAAPEVAERILRSDLQFDDLGDLAGGA
jgi:hypothetical protein